MSDEANIDDERVSVRVNPIPGMDGYDVWVMRYRRSADGELREEWLDPEGGWTTDEIKPVWYRPTLRISGFTLQLDKPLNAALRGLYGVERELTDRIQKLAEGAVMRALSGTPAGTVEAGS